MRISIILITLFMLTGCESLGEIIREKKYAFKLHETKHSDHEFGFNDDHDYVGYMVHGSFGSAPNKHSHTLYCEHNIKKNPQ